MMPKTKAHKTTQTRDTYMELVRRFPLKTIKNDDEHAGATKMVSELMVQTRQRGGRLSRRTARDGEQV